MKLINNLLINDVGFQLSSFDVRLFEDLPGNASFIVVSDEKPSGVVTFKMGYVGRAAYWVFIGYIEKCIQHSSSSWAITCKEFSNALQIDCAISLVHCTLTDVLNELHRLTKISFVIGEGDYSSLKVPRFQSSGSGFDVCQSIQQVFDIDDFIVQQQGDGSVFIGSWSDAFWSDKPVDVDSQFHVDSWANKTVLPIIPAIRPGCILNGERVKSVRHHESKMMVTYA